MGDLLAGVHYPRNWEECVAWFAADADCRDYLDWLRWGQQGFVARVGTPLRLLLRSVSMRDPQPPTALGAPLHPEPTAAEWKPPWAESGRWSSLDPLDILFPVRYAETGTLLPWQRTVSRLRFAVVMSACNRVLRPRLGDLGVIARHEAATRHAPATAPFAFLVGPGRSQRRPRGIAAPGHPR